MQPARRRRISSAAAMFLFWCFWWWIKRLASFWWTTTICQWVVSWPEKLWSYPETSKCNMTSGFTMSWRMFRFNPRSVTGHVWVRWSNRFRHFFHDHWTLDVGRTLSTWCAKMSHDSVQCLQTVLFRFHWPGFIVIDPETRVRDERLAMCLLYALVYKCWYRIWTSVCWSWSVSNGQ